MKFRPLSFLIACLLYTLAAFAQKGNPHSLLLKSGSFIPPQNISVVSVEDYNKKALRIDGKSFLIIQFENIPTPQQRKELQEAGIELLEYIPENAYTISVKNNIDPKLLERVKARAMVELKPEQKMPPSLAKGFFPSWSVKLQGTIDVWISFPKTLSYEIISKELTDRNFNIIGIEYKTYHVIALRIATNRVTELASLPFIEYVQPAPAEMKPLNNKSRNISRANILNASLAVGGRNLKGEGIVIGIGDNADPQSHVDFTGRLINRAATGFNYHGTHVSGIAGGAGIQMELYTGYAPKATLINQVFSGIITNAPAYVQDYGMVITNNSYGSIAADCSLNGLYDLYSRIVDQQAFELPALQHVFAAGNSGFDNCYPYPVGYKTIIGGFQSAKNVISVGNTYPDGLLFVNSSRGPVQDGRIKPEIVTQGTWVTSTASFAPYFENTGTSMAAPSVSGGLALLYQRYRELNSGTNPKSGLMKALICNGGDDMANDGPDFSSGFGRMNLLRSVDMLENTRYIISSLNNGNSNTHNITVPANTAQLKVMLYWHDPAAAVLSTQTLVNDLDLEVSDPSLVTTLPGILDTIPGNVMDPATTGADHINNIEQVSIKNPASGNYTITVNGTAITQAPPQEYFVVYNFVPVETKLTFPIGGEHLVPGETAVINWDSYGNPENTFTVQYSTDNGGTWIDINTSVASDLRQISWVVPSVSTDQALIKVLRNGTAMSSTGQAFTIIGEPILSLAATQCESYISITWGAIAGATDYEVMMLRGSEMVSVATITSTNYIFSGLSKDSVYWVSVRARLNGNPGRRGTAISRKPNTGTCAGAISNNDLKINALINPVSGRKFTSTELTAATIITAQIKNLDNAVVNNFTLKYSINGGAWITENVALAVAGGATYTHNFITTANLSAPGIYQLVVVVKNTTADAVTANDTLISIIKQLDNQPLNLSSTFLDNIETATIQSHTTAQTGLDGLDRYDFDKTTIYGRIRTFVNSGIAYSGTKALTIDADRNYTPGNTNFLSGTFNLNSYNAAINDVRFDFQYKHHGQSPDVSNRFWIRGSDSDPWIEAVDLDANQLDPGIFKLSPSIELSDLLNDNGQNFTSSFQVLWGQWGVSIAADNETGMGYTFDDIRLYEVFDDIQMVSIDSPVTASCALSSNVPVYVTVRNSSSNTINNIPIQLRVDGGAIISEVISTIPGNSALQYIFSATADLSSIGSHTLEVWVSYPTDSYRNNDTLITTIVNAPVITSFPSLENFEGGSGSWYTAGKRTSWEYGTPASLKINRAASGSKAWKTRLSGNYNDREQSYLYSPCYDISGMSNPTISLSIALDLEDCGGALCDGAYIEYSEDGATWIKLGNAGPGTNWYNSFSDDVWSVENYTYWHVATFPLPTGISKLRLRFVVVSDPFVNKEGIAIDDIHIYDNTMGIYDGATMGAPVSQNVSGGTNWIDFTDGGQLVASIQPNNQNLGNTNVQAYINAGPVRDYNDQYYHDRNITINPTNINLSDSVIVRFYFLESETENLLYANSCGTCTKPGSAYELGVSKYDDIDDNFENGTIIDDLQGSWSFINSSRAVKVPFDRGYYAEFKVKNFSEFWLNNGGFDNNHSLPVELKSFTATKNSNQVLVEWTTAAEFNVDRFEIEVAKGNSQYQLNNFIKIGVVDSKGNSTTEQNYNFTDIENNKSGVRYYRLKMIEADGTFTYSAVRAVVFNNEITWQVFPNPSHGIFNLVYQLNGEESITVKVYNINGKLVKQIRSAANGFVQKLTIDLQTEKYAAGLYLIEAENGDKKHVFKVIKQ